MSGHHEKLQQVLGQIQAQLDELREVDPEVAEHLEATVSQAQAVLAGRPAEAEEHHSMVESLTEAMQKSEASHPMLAGNLRSVIDALAQIGI